ncbi:hypothetical protein PanWU01x14_129080 [Parasponia andersonii]|uniref:Uncharacterized protein n=1 Tax=Parasponia andersonii TaxID=3476 RepID=A0A2P5CRW2_PARAD|nr:hypothetical protein PanWU01x14_129080 [Parasponia andersonii]
MFEEKRRVHTLLDNDGRGRRIADDPRKQFIWDVTSENLNSKNKNSSAAFFEFKYTSITNLQVIFVRKGSPGGIKSLTVVICSVVDHIPLLAPICENHGDYKRR